MVFSFARIPQRSPSQHRPQSHREPKQRFSYSLLSLKAQTAVSPTLSPAYDWSVAPTIPGIVPIWSVFSVTQLEEKLVPRTRYPRESPTSLRRHHPKAKCPHSAMKERTKTPPGTTRHSGTRLATGASGTAQGRKTRVPSAGLSTRILPRKADVTSEAPAIVCQVSHNEH